MYVGIKPLKKNIGGLTELIVLQLGHSIINIITLPVKICH